MLLLPSPTTMTRRVLRVYRTSELLDGRPVGLDWYHQAYEQSVKLADRFQLTVDQAAAIIAALSPQQYWEVNLRMAWQLCEERIANGQTKANIAKALDILDGGDPAQVLAAPVGSPRSGAKRRAFYDNIAHPGTSRLVTIDRHALAILFGRPLSGPERGILDRVGVYDACAGGYQRAGAIEGIPGHWMQSATWHTWRQTRAARQAV